MSALRMREGLCASCDEPVEGAEGLCLSCASAAVREVASDTFETGADGVPEYFLFGGKLLRSGVTRKRTRRCADCGEAGPRVEPVGAGVAAWRCAPCQREGGPTVLRLTRNN